MINYNVQNYLGQSAELINYIAQNQLTYIISGCGMGKSTFTKDFLMKKYITLNVNFLNTTNLQNFSDKVDNVGNIVEHGTYKAGENAAKNYDGKSNLSINVQNLDKIKNDALKNVEVLVIDEIQKMYQDSNYRGCCGTKLVEQIERFKAAGKKVIVMTGTPVEGVNFLKSFEQVKVVKTNIEEKDNYVFAFTKGTNKSNITTLVEKVRENGDFPVILANIGRNDLRRRLTNAGFIVGMVSTDDKKINSCTKYIIDNQCLPNDVDVIISTTVLQEGINLKDTDKSIVFITFIEDIKTPHQTIQFAGRARNQKKRLYLCYNTEEDFNINYTHCLYENINNYCLTDDINKEYEELMSEGFCKIEDWISYFKSYTECDIKELKLNGQKEKSVEKPVCTDWAEVIKYMRSLNNLDIIRPKKLSEDISYKVEVVAEVDENGKSKDVIHLFTDDANKCSQIRTALKEGLLKTDVEDIDTYLELIQVAKNVTYGIKTGMNSADNDKKALYGIFYNDIQKALTNGKFDEANVSTMIKSIFQIQYWKNGKEVSWSDIKESTLSRNDKRKVQRPIELIAMYEKTVLLLLSRRPEMNMPLYSFSNGFVANDIYATFAAEYDKQKNNTGKGAYANLKFELISDSSIKFKSLDEAFEYCKDKGLTKCNNKESFRKHSKNIISRIK